MRKGSRGRSSNQRIAQWPAHQQLPPPVGLIYPSAMKPLPCGLLGLGLGTAVAGGYDAALAFFQAWEASTLDTPKRIGEA